MRGSPGRVADTRRSYFMEASDPTTGEVFFTTPGFQHNSLALVTCELDNPRDPEEHDLVKGLLTPATRS
jgi:hypothetical protein